MIVFLTGCFPCFSTKDVYTPFEKPSDLQSPLQHPPPIPSILRWPPFMPLEVIAPPRCLKDPSPKYLVPPRKSDTRACRRSPQCFFRALLGDIYRVELRSRFFHFGLFCFFSRRIFLRQESMNSIDAITAIVLSVVEFCAYM